MPRSLFLLCLFIKTSDFCCCCCCCFCEQGNPHQIDKVRPEKKTSHLMLARLRLLQEILGLSGSLPLSDPDSAELLSEALRSGRLLSATLSPHTAAAWRRCAASLVAWIDSLQLPLSPAARRLESLLSLCRAALLRLIDR